CQVAEELGMRRVLAPGAAGLLSALGLIVAGERRDYVQSVLMRLEEDADLVGGLAPLRRRAEEELPGGDHEAAADCRYVGQSHHLTVAVGLDASPAALADAFHEAHESRYGDADRDRPVEAVSLRLAATRPGAQPDIGADGAASEPVHGPAVVPMDGATCWVASGWTARVDAVGTLVVERDG
ncbi:MAG: N-methylhydantoinase, partial [Miltoncostaeaceae bacterium]|nr:N-methylhydantoinase [Miltoncostaeaceae bacterium]